MRKSYILYIVIIVSILSSLCIIDNNTSALSYESSVGIGFTFNPTLSVSLSSSDLVISNLTPGSSANSNSINVSVATNAAYGYTLSANASSNDLVHSNNTNTFSSIAIDADLASLDKDENNNIWGYSTSLDNGSSWSNYNGLSSSTSTTLIDNSNTADSTGNIDFKIGAKAGSTQASGIYTNTINFIAVSKVAPMSLLDSFIASGAEQLNGYFKMQDMTHSICSNVDIEESELQLIDVRDNKIYWVAKLKDGNCWMTQNLDLDLSHDKPLTSNNTDLTDHSLSSVYADGYSYDAEAGVTIWVPSTYAETVDFEGTNIKGWTSSYVIPSSASKIDDTNTGHLSSGNWYNGTAVIASNDSSGISIGNAANSICPLNWRLPNANNSEFAILNNLYNNGSTSSDANLIIMPLYLTKSGTADTGHLVHFSAKGYYWSATITQNTRVAVNLRFTSDIVQPNYTSTDYGRDSGFSVRCLAR